MKNKPVNLIIEAARFKSNGQVEFVRAYQRRGKTFSDCVLFSRKELIDYILNGKTVASGQRVPLMGSTFKNIKPVKLITSSEHLYISSSDRLYPRDELIDIPVI